MHGFVTERPRVFVTDGDFTKLASQGRLYTAYVTYDVTDIRVALKAYGCARRFRGCCYRFRSIISWRASNDHCRAFLCGWNPWQSRMRTSALVCSEPPRCHRRGSAFACSPSVVIRVLYGLAFLAGIAFPVDWLIEGMSAITRIPSV